MLIRIPLTGEPTIQLLRVPDENMTMVIDTCKAKGRTADSLSALLRTASSKATIRTLSFNTHTDLHAFQRAITGHTVRFDAIACHVAISRRRMVVPIYKKWEASQVRVQVVLRGSNVQLLAFFEDFSHTDAMVIQLKGTDVYEHAKVDREMQGVKLVDAKFSLPKKDKESADEVAEEGDAVLDIASISDNVRRRFVNLEGLDYAEEHDDITIGFRGEGMSYLRAGGHQKWIMANCFLADLARFCEALPAPVTAGKGITFKRRI